MSPGAWSGALKLAVHPHVWPLRETFAICRESREHAHVVIVELRDADGNVGRGEAGGVRYRGETSESMVEQVECVREHIEAGCDRRQLLALLPEGGARHAVDAALWDLEATRTGVRVWKRAGFETWRPVSSAATLGIRSLAAYESGARSLADFDWIKIKLGSGDPMQAVSAVRRGASGSRLLVDPNQAWSVEELKEHLPGLVRAGVSLIEQPVPAEEDAGLAGWQSPIPLCADESFSTAADLQRVRSRYQFVNIKLDKVGGLTAGLDLAARARAAGLRLMVGCMLGGSVSVAPGMVLAQCCDVCDLDGPLLQLTDWEHGIAYEKGVMSEPWPSLWG